MYLPGSRPDSLSGKPTGAARLRVFICHECGTAEPVAWCGQSPNCGYPECTDALAKCATRHRVDDRHFRGRVNVVIVGRRLWNRYEDRVAEEAR